jgi:hypothetical protein
MTDEQLPQMVAYGIPVQLAGKDERGRQLYVCPADGCHEIGYIDDDGRGHCPCHEAQLAALAVLRDEYERAQAGLL